QRRDHGQDHDADDNAATQLIVGFVEPGNESGQEGRHRIQGEVAVDDGGDAGKDLQARLDEPTQPRAGIFAEINGGEQADGQGHGGGDDGHHERAGQQRQDAVLGVAEAGAPHGAGEEVDDGDLGVEEELDRAGEHDDDDGQRDADRQQPAEEQVVF